MVAINRAHTQSAPIPLHVFERNSMPLASAVVQVFAKAQATPTDFLITDERGLACCIDPSTLDSLLITHVAYPARIIYPADLRRAGDTLLLILHSEFITLPEAVVRERFSGIIVKGDTVRFDVQRFADGREVDLKELVNKLRGLESDGNGVLRYQGKPVDRVVIDGQDIVRSQFDFLNSLLRPSEVTYADVVTEDDKTGSSTTSVNIRTKTPQTVRGVANVGTSARGQPKAYGNLLNNKTTRLQGYLSTNLDYRGYGVNSTSDDLREEASEIMSITRRNEIGFARGRPSLPTPIWSAQGRAHNLQANLVAKRDTRRSELFIGYQQQTSLGSSSSSLRAAESGKLLGTLRTQNRQSGQRLVLNLIHNEKINSATTLDTWMLGVGQTYERREQGQTTIGGLANTFSFEQQPVDLYVRSGALLGLKLDSSWRFELYGTYAYEYIEQIFHLSDQIPLFGMVSSAESPFRITYQPKLRFITIKGDAHLTRTVGAVNLTGGLQMTRHRLVDEVDRANGTSELEAPLDRTGQTQIGVSALPYMRLKGKTNNHTLEASFGYEKYFTQNGELQGNRSSPYLKSRYTWSLPKAYRLVFLADAKLISFENQFTYTLNLPTSTRQITLGNNSIQPLAREYRGFIAITKSITSKDYSLSFDASCRDRNLQLTLRKQGSYLVYVPTIFSALRQLSSRASWSNTYGKTLVRASGNYLQQEAKENSSLRGVTNFRSSTFQGSLSLRTKWSDPVYTKFDVSVNRYSQRLPSANQLSSLSLTTVHPSAEIGFRGKVWTGTFKYQFLVRGSGAPVSVLGGSLNYHKAASPWRLNLTGQDLLRYNGSRFSDLIGGTDVVTALEYDRTQGSVTLSVSRQFGPGVRE